MEAAHKIVFPLSPGDDEVIFDGAPRPIVQDGAYEAAFTHHETASAFGRPKVYLYFVITTPGPQERTPLFKAYNVRALTGRPRRSGGFKLGLRHELTYDLSRLLGFKARPDRVSLHPLRHRVFRIRTRIVRRDAKYRELPEWQHYSVIDKIENEV